MGLHGNATGSLSFGGSGNCVGGLVGEENSGMAGMFFMMNEARCFVGFQGFAVATTAYMYALEYARTRKCCRGYPGGLLWESIGF